MKLAETFKKELAPALKTELGLKNLNAVPTLQKVTVSVAISPSKHKDGKLMETAGEVLKRITGQQPVKTKARISISNFKTRQGQILGWKVTLRGKRMWDFVEKLVHVTFPRVRDFRGIPKTVVDHQGNLSYGFVEHLAFPEVRSDEVEQVHGLQVTLTSSAKGREDGTALFKALGFPFQQ
ncbi:50S ribosomal protein L5 [Candidatus Uhrbacteria bacterium]|nr:50S ribosomal protein L5 [Candidatus Uhrbacteria bacterium]MBD3284398.1 50S ribosomal protein L5 [Candidatus Uhrbacteria bacterium]